MSSTVFGARMHFGERLESRLHLPFFFALGKKAKHLITVRGAETRVNLLGAECLPASQRA